MVVAGEVSGDMHAAAVIRSLRSRMPDLTVFGLGGDEMAAAGAELLHHVRDLSVMGLYEVLKRYGYFRRIFAEVLEAAERRRPDAVLLVDYPGFNLRLARRLRGRGPRLVYYVCPQVWAWKRGRIATMARDLDRLLTIFPFEARLFKGTGLAVDFVGHPLVDEAARALAAPPRDLPWCRGARLALLPGSRRQELERILPPMVEAVRFLRERSEIAPVVATPNPEVAQAASEIMDGNGGALPVVVGQTREVLRQARAGLVTSGTATLEAALMDCPMVVAYRTSPLTYAAARRVVRVPHIGMVNLVAEREVCPERIQDRCTGSELSEAVAPLLEDGPAFAAMKSALADVRARLGEGGAADRAAACLAEELERGP